MFFFHKEALYNEPTRRRAKNFVLLKTKSLRNFSIPNIVDCKEFSIRKPVQFIAVNCFVDGFPLELDAYSILS